MEIFKKNIFKKQNLKLKLRNIFNEDKTSGLVQKTLLRKIQKKSKKIQNHDLQFLQGFEPQIKHTVIQYFPVKTLF